VVVTNHWLLILVSLASWKVKTSGFSLPPIQLFFSGKMGCILFMACTKLLHLLYSMSWCPIIRLVASSQIEITSSSPFVCGLRDHNRRERCNRESKRKKESHGELEEGLSILLADLNRHGLPWSLLLLCSSSRIATDNDIALNFEDWRDEFYAKDFCNGFFLFSFLLFNG